MATLQCLFHLCLLVLVLVAPSSEGGRPGWLNGPWLTNNADEKQDNSTAWAVLVAGSNGYGNYRHQADVCHAYQVLKRGGLKDENIVVFMYDDIAYNPENPRPGVIINNPKGDDVYAGVPKDYTGDDVTAHNLYAVLLGDKKSVKGGSGKVIDSKPNDRIFIYYTDHGGPGVLGMPNLPYVYANHLIEVLEKKHAAGTYKEMVIYVEACESGSIFEGLLPENLNIYVTTASNATESSLGTYCPEMKPPPPPEYDTCLGDMYSVAWMEDSDREYSKKETLYQQYEKVKVRTYANSTGSNVMEYGTRRISSERVSLYQGFATSKLSKSTFQYNGPMGGVDQRDADLKFLWRKYNKSTDGSQQKTEILKRINDITNHRVHLDNSIGIIGDHLFGQQKGRSILTSVRDKGMPIVEDWGCLKSMVRFFETHCGSLTQYGIKHMRAFANICNNGITQAAMDRASMTVCRGYNMGKWNPSNVGYSA